MSRGFAFDRVWTDLGLPGTPGSLDDIRLADLAETVEAACSDGIVERGGLRRWNGRFDEWKLIEARRGYGAGVLLLLPLAWLLSDLRAGRGVREKGSLFDGLSLGGGGRMGMRQVVLPRLRRMKDRNPTVAEAIGELVGLTVAQHSHIALSRLAANPEKDVAVVRVEGERWIGLRGFAPGRAASRLLEMTGWLHQLELISDAGLTEEGETILARALDTLEPSLVYPNRRSRRSRACRCRAERHYCWWQAHAAEGESGSRWHGHWRSKETLKWRRNLTSTMRWRAFIAEPTMRSATGPAVSSPL